ncbi:hypothetical protein HUW63_02820 [Myxococcus sp. AM001]|nr:hypothetical protein [Myxococcus sp. AM001]
MTRHGQVQGRPQGDGGADVVRRRVVAPYKYYAFIRQYEEETWRGDVACVHLELWCIRKAWFDRLEGPPFPPMRTLARVGGMLNVTLEFSPEQLSEVNGVLGPVDPEQGNDDSEDDVAQDVDMEFQPLDAVPPQVPLADEPMDVLQADEVDIHARAQPAHLHEGNWIEVWFSNRQGPQVIIRKARHDDPALIGIDPDERLWRLLQIRRIRPPSTLIRLRQFTDPDAE